jgi:hypothetical protein
MTHTPGFQAFEVLDRRIEQFIVIRSHVLIVTAARLLWLD